MAERNELRAELERRGISRRDFARFCAVMAAALGLPARAAAQILEAVDTGPKPILVWLEFQDCAGNTESFLRAARPSVADVVLDVLSVDYHETIMAAAGHQAEDALHAVVRDKAGEYIAVVEGAIPTADNGVYCTIGGRSALQIAREVCRGAAATVAVGTCAAFGGLPAAAPNPTRARSVEQAISGIGTLINMPACPVNAENLTALIVHYLTFGRWPPTDRLHRPLFAYGKTIHDNCERRAHYDSAQYVEQWGDDGHRAGYCLFKMGCKGPVTFQNCPNIRWNDGTNWPIGCGHPCLGCAEPAFWDRMTPFYTHLSGIPGIGPAADLDTVGAVAVGGVAAAFATHGLLQIGRRKLAQRGAASPTSATSKEEPAEAETKAAAGGEPSEDRAAAAASAPAGDAGAPEEPEPRTDSDAPGDEPTDKGGSEPPSTKGAEE